MFLYKPRYRAIYQGCTGCGKTVIAISAIRHEIERGKKVLVLVPSKELLANWDKEIRRIIAVVPGVDKPTSNSDLYTVLRVNESGSILSSADSEHFVKGIMTKEVSRFFLFDGELLTEYEELLNENSVRGGSIKSSIEQILGMPILSYGASDSDVAASTIATEARKVAQNEQAVSKYNKRSDPCALCIKIGHYFH